MYMAEVIAIIVTVVTTIARVIETLFKKIEESATGCYQPRKEPEQTERSRSVERQPRCCVGCTSLRVRPTEFSFYDQ
jgi:hypothetical protein